MSQLQERKRLEILSFKTPGQSMRGKLMGIDVVEIDQRAALRYVIKDEVQDRLYSLLGTVDLNNKIRRTDIGRILQIRYEGMDTANIRAIKRFLVHVENHS